MSDHSHAHEPHLHGGPKVYLAVLLGLLFLTIVTVAASRVDFGSANVAIAMFIATIKASLVCLWFMHLKYDKPVNAMIFVATLFFLTLFFLFPYLDTNSRADLKPSNWHGPKYAPDSGSAVVGIGANFPVEPKEKPKAAPAPQH